MKKSILKTIFAAAAMSAALSCSEGEQTKTSATQNLTSQGTELPAGSSCLESKDYSSTFSQTVTRIDHIINLDTAVRWVKNYQIRRSALNHDSTLNENSFPEHETYHLDAINKLMCQPTTVAFRIYLGLDGDQRIKTLLVGVEADGLDVIMRKIDDPDYQPKPTTSGLILDNAMRKP